MSGIDWTVTPETKPVTEYTHTATIEGLAIEVKERSGNWITWRVIGFLDDIDISASDYHFHHDRTVEQAKAAAVAAAHRLYGAGVRGEKSHHEPTALPPLEHLSADEVAELGREEARREAEASEKGE